MTKNDELVTQNPKDTISQDAYGGGWKVRLLRTTHLPCDYIIGVEIIFPFGGSNIVLSQEIVDAIINLNRKT